MPFSQDFHSNVHSWTAGYEFPITFIDPGGLIYSRLDLCVDLKKKKKLTPATWASGRSSINPVAILEPKNDRSVTHQQEKKQAGQQPLSLTEMSHIYRHRTPISSLSFNSVPPPLSPHKTGGKTSHNLTHINTN